MTGTPPALHAARLQREPRTPFVVDGVRVGSVADAHLPALTAWPQWVGRRATGAHPGAVELRAAPGEREHALDTMNDALRAQGLIRAWRDERFALFDPADGRVLATFERAAARFWGTLTLGAHCNGFVAGPDGRPTHLWIAQRSPTKATDPGLHDNLIGGGVPHGQTPLETVIREGWEEAGLQPADMAGLTPGRVIELDRDVPEGRQFERLHVFDLALAPDVRPCNQDGEVAALACLPLAQAAGIALSATMTVDAALVTLDFLLRWQALPAALHAQVEAGMQALWA